MALLRDRDIFAVVASDYLDVRDLVTLDTAVASPDERPDFLEVLKSLPYKPPFSDSLEKWWRCNKKCMAWLLQRAMFNPEGDFWHVNKKLWSSLLDDTEVDFKPFLGCLKELFFEGFGAPYDLPGLQYCTSLERLQLCNYNQPLTNASPPNVPRLREVILQNTKICDATLRNFENVTSLAELNMRHVTFEALSEGVLNHFLNQLRVVRVLNRVDEFMTHFCTKPNRFEVVAVDMLHTTQTTEFSLEPLLKNSPHLRELHIERMCIDIQTVFQLIAAHCPALEFLHLNHVRLAVDGSSRGTTFSAEVPFSRLQISTLLPSLDSNYVRILEMTRGKVRHLHISFAERLTDGGYHQVRDLVPNLHTLEIDEKKEVFDGEGDRARRFERIVDLFRGSIANLRVSLWDTWRAEHLKKKYASQSKLVFSQGGGF